MVGSLKIGSGPPYNYTSLEKGDVYYDTLCELMYYVDSQNRCMQVLCENVPPQKQESRCEYCGCLYTSDEVICLHCGAPR